MLNAIANFQKRVDEAKYESGAPGLSFAVLHDGEIVSAAAGVLSVDTGIEATASSEEGSMTSAVSASGSVERPSMKFRSTRLAAATPILLPRPIRARHMLGIVPV